MNKKKLGSVLLAIIILLCMSGCSGKQVYQPIDDVSDLGGCTVGVNLAWSADYMLSGRDDMTLVRYNTVASLVMALRYGQVDVIAMERPFAIVIMNCMSGLRMVEPATATDELVACVNIDRTDVAARTLGMTRFQSFWYIILPQTVKTVLPVYKNQFISCLQETSVVGYLAIMDLTRASDIVSARTFDALFALLAVTLIYLIIGLGVGALINVAERKKHLGGEAQ